MTVFRHDEEPTDGDYDLGDRVMFVIGLGIVAAVVLLGLMLAIVVWL